MDVTVNEAVIEALSSALERARERGLVVGGLTPGDLLRFPQAISITDRKDESPDEAIRRRSKRRWPRRWWISIRCGPRKGRTCGPSSTAGAPSSATCSIGPRRRRRSAEAMRVRLAERVKEMRADTTVDEAAIAQEIVRYANRSDVTEETVRFRAHLEHFMLTVEMEGDNRITSWVGFGVLWGVIGLTNPSTLSFLPFAGGWLAYQLIRRNKRFLLPAVVGAILFWMTMMPWLVRNYEVFHKPVFVRDNVGVELRCGNNPVAEGVWVASTIPARIPILLGNTRKWARPPTLPSKARSPSNGSLRTPRNSPSSPFVASSSSGTAFRGSRALPNG